MISIIAAVARNMAIGRGNELIYWLPNDLRRFKALTTGHTIIMGRRTFQSLPKGALPNRRNIVLTRSGKEFPGAETYSSLREALDSCLPSEEVFVIGGATVYAEALPLADRLCLTEVDDEADAFFPQVSSDLWKVSSREEHGKDEKHDYTYTFTDYIRR